MTGSVHPEANGEIVFTLQAPPITERKHRAVLDAIWTAAAENAHLRMPREACVENIAARVYAELGLVRVPRNQL